MTRARSEAADTDTDPDPNLVRRAQEGDRGAFEVLYRRHVGRIYGLCLRLTGDRGQAEELTQTTFVRAWRRLETYAGTGGFVKWLQRICVNAAVQEHRSDTRRTARVVTAECAGEMATGWREPADELCSRIDLERAIAGLPPGARAVLVLHDIEGYRHDEIAGILGTAPGTCKAQLHRARRLLREHLQR